MTKYLKRKAYRSKKLNDSGHKEREESYTLENHNVTAQTQWKKYSLNNSQGKETHYIQRNKSNDSKNNRRFLNASDKIVVQLL